MSTKSRMAGCQQLPPLVLRGRAGVGAIRRTAFTFTEVLFAVILLGIGFIMLAAMFPVAIQQTQVTIEETAGASLGQIGARTVGQIATDTLMPATGGVGANGVVSSFRGGSLEPLWDNVRGHLILSNDRRYAWVPMYRRDLGDNFVQVTIIGVQSRLKPLYDSSDAYNSPSTFEPKQVGFSLTSGGAGADTITFNVGPNGPVWQGTYVVVSSDTSSSPAGKGNGYVYRVGNFVSSNNANSSTWQLMPGNDTKGAIYFPTGGTALIVGRALNTAVNPAVYEGPAQDVCAYTTFVRLN